MKFKHKPTGTIIQTYNVFQKEIIDVDQTLQEDYGFNVNVPYKIIKDDSNWEEIEDDRWKNMPIRIQDVINIFKPDKQALEVFKKIVEEEQRKRENMASEGVAVKPQQLYPKTALQPDVNPYNK